ncbi:hypothetical protein Ami103574_10130 [Aminipila butyrica]|uniref:ABC-2 type transport system permease protein n=1 Tax=Aminipila butyrica TaxID=433296 RepID=A0A858BVP5_9FIRM|nr:hypothetical protein [Aminipila butyrica]QIB69657.1 hypothetical protein Ami103574_10130 [Aminipila butyrica]
MKSRTSYFSVSIPLVKENLRRFWAIPAVGFLAYFLSGIFPILMSYRTIDHMYSYIDMCLSNSQPFFMAIHLMLPIITAVIIFRYLQTSSSVTTMHAMPFTRAQLFNSSFLSGFILILLPLLANEIIFQLIVKPTYDPYMYKDYPRMTILDESAINIFTHANVFQWFWHSLLILMVIYAISIFAGLVTGNSVMHLSLAVGFNFLAPALYLTFVMYCSNYLFGFTAEGIHGKILAGLSPFVQSAVGGGEFTPAFQVYYLLLFVGIVALSSFLYQKRQMEKAGDPIVFHFMIPAICYLIAYFGMSLMSYYFTSLATANSEDGGQNVDAYFYSGLAAGGVISFILGRMIVLKTPRIFNKSSLKSFGIFALGAALFISSITLDLTNFEDRVPKESSLKGVYSNSFKSFNSDSRYTAHLFSKQPGQYDKTAFRFTDPKNIQALTNLHRQIVKDKKQIEKEESLNVQSYLIDLFYDMSTPLDLQRAYNLTYKRVHANPYFKQVYESQEFKDYFSFNRLNHQSFTKITLENSFYYDDSLASHLLITDQSRIGELLAAMETDFQNRTYEQEVSSLHSYCTLYLDYTYLNEKHKLERTTLDLSILSTDVQTIKWLRDNGYGTYLEFAPDQIASIIFTKQDVKKNEEEAAERAALDTKEFTTAEMTEQAAAEETENQLIITDPQQIQQILNSFSGWNNNYDLYYEGTIVFKPRDGIRSAYSDTIFYDPENVPAFISGYFE